MANEKDNCSKHPRDVNGVTDMKSLAESIGNLHYETLDDFLYQLNAKLHNDGGKDCVAGKTTLGVTLFAAADKIMEAKLFINKAWKISKPFMQNNKK